MTDDIEQRFDRLERAAGELSHDVVSYVPIEQLRKFLFYYEELKALREVPGDLVEFGTFRGSTLCFLSDANLLLDGPNTSRSIIGFDTFCGFPEAQPSGRARDEECSDLFREASPAIIRRKLAARPGHRVRIVEGDITKTLPEHLKTWGNRIALAICDADLAHVTRAILEGIWGRMMPGGRIYFDEYSRDGWSETDGVDAFLESRGLPLSRVKRASGMPVAYLEVEPHPPL